MIAMLELSRFLVFQVDGRAEGTLMTVCYCNTAAR
jgi:hypothetical protein